MSILIRCLMDIHGGMSLKKDKIYEAVQGEHGLVQVVDESGEDYLYPYQIFETSQDEPKQALEDLRADYLLNLPQPAQSQAVFEFVYFLVLQ